MIGQNGFRRKQIIPIAFVSLVSLIYFERCKFYANIFLGRWQIKRSQGIQSTDPDAIKLDSCVSSDPSKFITYNPV